MIQIKRLDHVVLRTRHAEALIEFYCRVLGCTVERTTAPETGITQLRAGEALIDILAIRDDAGEQTERPSATQGHNMDHFCVQLETFDEPAIRAHLARHGVTGSPLESRYGAEGYGPSIYIQDPEGNIVELKGPPA